MGRHKTIQPPHIRFPGPGAYDPAAEAFMHKSPQFSMGIICCVLNTDYL